MGFYLTRTLSFLYDYLFGILPYTLSFELVDVSSTLKSSLTIYYSGYRLFLSMGFSSTHTFQSLPRDGRKGVRSGGR